MRINLHLRDITYQVDLGSCDLPERQSLLLPNTMLTVYTHGFILTE